MNYYRKITLKDLHDGREGACTVELELTLFPDDTEWDVAIYVWPKEDEGGEGRFVKPGPGLIEKTPDLVLGGWPEIVRIAAERGCEAARDFIGVILKEEEA